MKPKDCIYMFRKDKGYTQEDLAKLIGVSKQTVQKYESGEIETIPLETICKIASVLDTTPIDILGLREYAVNDERLIKIIHKISLLPDEQIAFLDSVLDSMKSNLNKHQK